MPEGERERGSQGKGHSGATEPPASDLPGAVGKDLSDPKIVTILQ